LPATRRARTSDADIERALEIFARGFCFTRSFTHPYLAERVGPLWVMRDGPRKKNDYRNEEWIAFRVPPAKADRIARSKTRGRFVICAIRSIDETDEPLRAAYKSMGYRLTTTEPLMIHRLKRIPRLDAPAAIERVTTIEQADALNKAARSRQVLPDHLVEDAPLRQYIARSDDGQIAGWVRSIVAGDGTWVSNMYVEPAHRRRGIGRAMLARMLRDDRALGATLSALLASHTGAMLYPVVGYEQLGELLLFVPKRKK
jgi:GNAT superfamily N-acetyltransferase